MKTQLTSTLLLATWVTFTPLSGADSPPLIPFQGHLARPNATDPTRFEPVPSGRYDILFTLYAAPVGGESKVWGPERHPQVTVVNGLLNALLGSVLGFEDTLAAQPNFFRRPLYVGITVDADGNPNTADLELVPRQVLLPAVQALNANTLDGADWRTFFIGTDADATFTPGTTKARDADLFDGIDAAALFIDPSNTANPKVKQAAVADAVAGNLDITGSLEISGDLEVAGSGAFQGALAVGGPGLFQGQVTSVVNGISYFMVPRGTIVLWAGEPDTIPGGWALCDGVNGTPDLRNRFVRGHPHDGDTIVGQTGGTGTHTHRVNGSTSTRGPTAGALAAYNGNADWFTEGHSHTFDVTSGAAPHLPPYLVLAYIMKL
jgi:hypothetical protein